MSTIPKPITDRLAATIKSAATTLRVHAQQIATLQTTTAAIVPGDWEDITLEAGWSNLAGFIPAQVRILQNGMSQVVGHITGGTVANGTVIGTLTAGYFNPVHAHAFTCNAITGAAAVAHPGALSDTTGLVTEGDTMIPTGDHTLPGSVTASNTSIPTADHDFGNGNTNIPTANHVISSTPFTLGPSGVQFVNAADWSFTLGPSGVQFDNAVNGAAIAAQLGPTSGIQFQNAVNGAATDLNNGATATNVNMNTPTITLDTSGQLTINNVDLNVTQISFSELIPLVTA